MENSATPVTKTWCYSETTNRHTTNYTITVSKNRFSHQAEQTTAGHTNKQRTDINVKNIHSVSSYYGLSRNVIGTILLAILAVVSLITGIVQLTNRRPSSSPGLAIALIVLAVIFCLVAFLVYRKIKPAFFLELNLIQEGKLQSNMVAHGSFYKSIHLSFGKKHRSPLFYIFLVVVWPVGLVYLISRFKGKKYVFSMDPETGNDIVDTIGELLIDD